MKPLSASEAVKPAVERTVNYLFRPFQWWTYLKLAGIGMLTEGTLVNVHYSITAVPADFDVSPWWAIHVKPEYLPVEIVAGIASFVVALLLYVLLIQLRFAFFRCVANGGTRLWPAWRVSRGPAERFARASLTVWLALLGLVVLFVALVALMVFVVFTARTPEGKLDPGVFLILFFPCVGFAAFIFSLTAIAEVTMHDFILPHMAIENATFRQAWARVWLHFRVSKGTFFSYLILRLLLPFLVMVVLIMTTSIALPAVYWILGTSVAGYSKLIDVSSAGGAFLDSALNVMAPVINAGIGVFVAIVVGGPIGVYIRNYALVFYGSRYEALGHLLVPTADEIAVNGLTRMA